MNATPEEELRRSIEQLLAERTRELATLLSIRQATTSRLERQEVRSRV